MMARIVEFKRVLTTGECIRETKLTEAVCLITGVLP